jgi:predicted ArsR family transcriptional regulator
MNDLEPVWSGSWWRTFTAPEPEVEPLKVRARPAGEPDLRRQQVMDAIGSEWQSLRQIAHCCGLGRDTVRNHVSALISQGSIERRKQAREQQSGVAYLYRRAA